MIRNHLEPDFIAECGYCGKQFERDEAAIEREILGRQWRFCSDACYANFTEGMHGE